MARAPVDITHLFDPTDIEALARQTGFVVRTSPITGMRFLVTFTAGLLNTPGGTLAQLAAFLGVTCGVPVSTQALDERMNGAATRFMRMCLAKALAMSSSVTGLGEDALRMLDHVYIIDSTRFELHPTLAPKFKGNGGGASSAAMRIQFAFDYRTGIMHLEIGDVNLSDPGTLARWVREGVLPMDGTCLFLTDLGYFKTATFAQMRTRPDCHFLSKLQFGVHLTQTDGTLLDLRGLLRKRPATIELNVRLGDTPCRLVGKRLPDPVVAEKIRKANAASESKSRHISDEYRLFLHYALCITSLPPEYSIDQLFVLYRIRWQIELIFKVWKSVLAIHRVHSAKEDRVLCEVYGKLTVAVLLSVMRAATEAVLDGLTLSIHRAARHLQSVATNWALAIVSGVTGHRAFLIVLQRTLAKLCRKTRHRSKPTIDTILSHAMAGLHLHRQESRPLA